jgi:alkylation response protein AidB-like acyl-CoA dehydrogenase
LRRIAAERLVLVSTGASDWIDSSGHAEKVDGGYRVNGRKIFGSGSPAGDLLMTSFPYDDPTDQALALHMAIPLRAEGVTIADNWRTMGMRATGSNDVLLQNVFVPDAAVSMRRPRGVWHAFFTMLGNVPLPLIMSAYLGIAETAADLARQMAAKKRADADLLILVGEMENQLIAAQVTVESMVALCQEYTFPLTDISASQQYARKTLAAQAVLATVEKACEVAGGASFFRGLGLERLLRDVHGARFHPLPEKRQQLLSGRVALGFPPV